MNLLKKIYSSARGVVKNEKGFTLLELIAVIAILGIIAAISFTAFSTQGEKARMSAHKTNIVTIEQAAERYETEKGFRTGTDFTRVTSTHNLVTEGYLKESPKNPWASTNKTQSSYNYIITKDKRGMYFAYLADNTTGAAVPNVVNNTGDEGTVSTSASLSLTFGNTALTSSSAAGARFFEGN